MTLEGDSMSLCGAFSHRPSRLSTPVNYVIANGRGFCVNGRQFSAARSPRSS